MLRLTCLPKNVSNLLHTIRPLFRHRHHLVFGWILVLHLVYRDKATLRELSRSAPQHIAYWHLRRLLCAGYWCTKVLLWWFADQAIRAFPPPKDGVCYVVADGTLKGKKGKKNPCAKKWRLSKLSPYLFGIHIVILMVQWDVFRIPVDFEIVLEKKSKDYQTENALFREMLERFCPPPWARCVVVVADCAYASKANLKLIKKLGYYFVIAFARTWKFEDGKALKHLVNHLPKCFYRKIWVPSLTTHRRRVWWVYAKKTSLRHVGEVTVVLSKRRRNGGPKTVKVIVTNLPSVTARQVVAIYQRRWCVELLIKELKGVVGMGQHQVTKKPDRVYRSVAVSIMAYLMLLRLRAGDIQPGRAWSAFALKRAFTWDVMQEQMDRSAHQLARKYLQESKRA